MPQTKEKLKLFNILSRFSKAELDGFEWYIEKLAYKTNQSHLNLFCEIKKFHPEFKSHSKIYEKLYSSIYPERKFNLQTIKTLLSDLLTLTKKYIAHVKLERDFYTTKRLFIESLSGRNLYGMFETEMKTLEKIIDEERKHSRNYYFRKMEAYELRNSFYLNLKPVGKSSKEVSDIVNVSRHVTYFYLSVMFEEYFRGLIGERIVKLDNRKAFTKEFLEILLKLSEDFKDEPLVAIFVSFIEHHHDSESITKYRKAKSLLLKHENEIPYESFRVLYNKLLNHCVSRLKTDKFRKECFAVVNEMLERKLFLEYDGTLKPHNYTVIASLALRLEKFKWAEEFINDYKNLLPESTRKNTYTYNTATYYYMLGVKSDKKKKRTYFEKSLSIIKSFRGNDFYEKLRINNLLLIIHYELGNTETALSLCDSYRHYLSSNNKDIPEHLFKGFSAFVKYTRKLLLISGGTLKTPADEYVRMLERAPEFEYKGWLLKKAKEM